MNAHLFSFLQLLLFIQAINAEATNPEATNPEATNVEATNAEATEVDTTFTYSTWMDIGVDGEFLGRIEFGLYGNATPLTSENFRSLCTGEKGIGSTGVPLHFKGMIWHRVIPNFICQGGDYVFNTGAGGDSIYGPQFDDENFDVKHTKKGLLSMANWGRDTNKSQFSIMMGKARHLNDKHVVFGEVTNGWDVVRVMNSLGDDKSEKPIRRISVLDCGELTADTPPAPQAKLLDDLSYCLDDPKTARKCIKWASPCKEPHGCSSGNKDCCGQCTLNTEWMNENCCASCSAGCEDAENTKSCAGWAKPCEFPPTCASGGTDCCDQCTLNADWMMRKCCRTCRRLAAAYSSEECNDSPKQRMDCLSWAQPCSETKSCPPDDPNCCGQCELNESWMNKNCCASCKARSSYDDRLAAAENVGDGSAEVDAGEKDGEIVEDDSQKEEL